MGKKLSVTKSEALSFDRFLLNFRYNFKTYKMCFQGRDLVQFVVQTKWQDIASVESAVMYGQRLLDGGVLHHVADKRAFEVSISTY